MKNMEKLDQMDVMHYGSFRVVTSSARDFAETHDVNLADYKTLLVRAEGSCSKTVYSTGMNASNSALAELAQRALRAGCDFVTDLKESTRVDEDLFYSTLSATGYLKPKEDN